MSVLIRLSKAFLDPTEMIAVNEAYNLVRRTLQHIGQLGDRNHRPRSLASAKTGERDANMLCELAIHGLTAFDYRLHHQ
jgi:hypothetical protein